MGDKSAFVEKHAEGKNITASVGGLTAKLLRRHVGYSPAGAVLSGSASGKSFLGFAGRAVSVSEASNSEIEDFYARLAVEHDIGGLDVAMKDTDVVSFL
jgi:hypothetical protein